MNRKLEYVAERLLVKLHPSNLMNTMSRSQQLRNFSPLDSEQFYHNQAFPTLDCTFISYLAHTHLKDHFLLDHFARIFNIAKPFYWIQPKIINDIYMCIINSIRSMAVRIHTITYYLKHSYTDRILTKKWIQKLKLSPFASSGVFPQLNCNRPALR